MASQLDCTYIERKFLYYQLEIGKISTECFSRFMTKIKCEQMNNTVYSHALWTIAVIGGQRTVRITPSCFLVTVVKQAGTSSLHLGWRAPPRALSGSSFASSLETLHIQMAPSTFTKIAHWTAVMRRLKGVAIFTHLWPSLISILRSMFMVINNCYFCPDDNCSIYFKVVTGNLLIYNWFSIL